LTLAVASILGSGFQAVAQDVQTLLNWNANWRYNQQGTELGPAWRAASYPQESTWAGPGPGLFGFEDAAGNAAYGVHAPFQTPLTVSSTVTSYYFRTTFQFSGSTAGLSVYATNFIDDGAVFYLNGTEVYRLRITPANPLASTLASGGPATEGTLEPFTVTNLALLKQGANTMAVEVHQNANTSSDIVFGMKLISSRATPLSITSQPQDTTISVGESLSLTVGVSGGPAVYRWYKVPSTTPLSGAIGPTFSIATPQQSSSGQYYAIVTNVLGAVTSRVATVTVLADTEGPLVIDARGDTNTFASRGAAQTIAISFTEGLNQQISTNPANFAVYAGTNFNTRITVTNVLYNFSTLPRIYLFMTGPGWFIGSNYFVVLNGVADTKGNLIAPNTRVPVSWEIVTNLTQMGDNWDFHDSWAFDPEIFNSNPPWYATNYQISTSGWWGTGRGILWYDPSSVGFTCAGDTLGRLISFQNQPTLFRRTFNIPPGFGTNGVLRLRYTADDGMLLYLNGREVHAYNMASNITVNATTKATSARESTCITNVSLSLTNLRTGVNYLAAAVVQSNPETESDTSFGLEMDGVFLRSSPVPADPPASGLKLTIARQSDPNCPGGQLTLSWPNTYSGYSLQYRVDLGPDYPWITVSNQANPYVTPLCDGPRFFRLGK
jgi:hypothetical protein